MFFGNERKKLEEKINILERKLEKSCIVYQVGTLFESLKILLNENFLSYKEIEKYFIICFMKILNSTAQDIYNLKGFEISEDPVKKKEFEDRIVETWLFFIELANKKEKISEVDRENFNTVCNNIKVITSPDPKCGFNISDFKKNRE